MIAIPWLYAERKGQLEKHPHVTGDRGLAHLQDDF